MSTTLRVAVVSDAVAPYHCGGKETRYDEVTRRLAGHDVAVTICTMRWWDGAAPPDTTGIRWRALCRWRPMYTTSGRRSLVQAAMFSLGCLRLLRGDHHLIEADHMPGPQVLVLRAVATLRRTPLQVTWHEVWGAAYWRSYLPGPAGRIAALVERWSARSADRIVAASPGTAQRLVDVLDVDPARVEVIENGVDLAAIDAATALPGAPLLFVGRLIDHKRVDVLLRAVATLRASGRSVALDVIGDGPARAELAALTDALGIADLVRFLGPVASIDEVWGRMKGARAFVTASEREGFGIAVIEALAAGVPVVVSDHEGNEARRLVRGDLGFVARAGDAADFARRIAEVLDRHDQPSVVRARFDREHASLTWDRSAARYADSCRTVLAGVAA